MTDRAWIGAQIAVVVVVLAAAIYGFAISGRPEASPVASPTGSASIALPTPTGSSATSPSARPSGSPTPSPQAATQTPSPTPTRKPLSFAPYAFNGHSYTGVTLGTGWTILAPFDGHAEVHLYQLINGSIRESTSVAGVPVYPYIDVTASDGRRMRYRPGASETDTKVIVAASADVRSGDPLFTVVGTGLSSWHDFYDSSITFQIVVSLTSSAGNDLDASPLIKAK